MGDFFSIHYLTDDFRLIRRPLYELLSQRRAHGRRCTESLVYFRKPSYQKKALKLQQVTVIGVVLPWVHSEDGCRLASGCTDLLQDIVWTYCRILCGPTVRYWGNLL